MPAQISISWMLCSIKTNREEMIKFSNNFYQQNIQAKSWKRSRLALQLYELTQILILSIIECINTWSAYDEMRKDKEMTVSSATTLQPQCGLNIVSVAFWQK